MLNSEGGNVDMRVPYIGYGAESELYKADRYFGLQRVAGARRKAA